MEWLCNQFSGTFGDLAGTLDSACSHILTGFTSTFAHVPGRGTRMQRRQVAGPFTNAFGSFACALACAFAYITAAVADITAGALSLGWGCGIGLRGSGLRDRRLTLGRILAVCGNTKSKRRQKQQCGKSSHNVPPLYSMRDPTGLALLSLLLAALPRVPSDISSQKDLGIVTGNT
jgi:hypothetical protein